MSEDGNRVSSFLKSTKDKIIKPKEDKLGEYLAKVDTLAAEFDEFKKAYHTPDSIQDIQRRLNVIESTFIEENKRKRSQGLLKIVSVVSIVGYLVYHFKFKD